MDAVDADQDITLGIGPGTTIVAAEVSDYPIAGFLETGGPWHSGRIAHGKGSSFNCPESPNASGNNEVDEAGLDDGGSQAATDLETTSGAINIDTGSDTLAKHYTNTMSWFFDRLDLGPALRLLRENLRKPVPPHVNWLFTLGASIAGLLALQLFSGLLLMVHYKPSAREAYGSIEKIMDELSLLTLHNIIFQNRCTDFIQNI